MPDEPAGPRSSDQLAELPHERLRRMLDRAGLSNGELAKLLEVATATVSRWRSGQQEMRRRDLRAVIRLLADRGFVITEEWIRSGEVLPEPDPFGNGVDMGLPTLPLRDAREADEEEAKPKRSRGGKRAS